MPEEPGIADYPLVQMRSRGRCSATDCRDCNPGGDLSKLGSGHCAYQHKPYTGGRRGGGGGRRTDRRLRKRQESADYMIQNVSHREEAGRARAQGGWGLVHSQRTSASQRPAVDLPARTELLPPYPRTHGASALFLGRTSTPQYLFCYVFRKNTSFIKC